MKLKSLSSMLLAIALTAPAVGQISVFIGREPPRPRHERRGRVPGPGYMWVDGYWAPHGRKYRWVSGRWERPPYEGARWTPARYEHEQRGWQLREGHWDRDDHDRHDRDHDHDHNH